MNFNYNTHNYNTHNIKNTHLNNNHNHKNNHNNNNHNHNHKNNHNLNNHNHNDNHNNNIYHNHNININHNTHNISSIYSFEPIQNQRIFQQIDQQQPLKSLSKSSKSLSKSLKSLSKSLKSLSKSPKQLQQQILPSLSSDQQSSLEQDEQYSSEQDEKYPSEQYGQQQSSQIDEKQQSSPQQDEKQPSSEQDEQQPSREEDEQSSEQYQQSQRSLINNEQSARYKFYRNYYKQQMMPFYNEFQLKPFMNQQRITQIQENINQQKEQLNIKNKINQNYSKNGYNQIHVEEQEYSTLSNFFQLQQQLYIRMTPLIESIKIYIQSLFKRKSSIYYSQINLETKQQISLLINTKLRQLQIQTYNATESNKHKIDIIGTAENQLNRNQNNSTINMKKTDEDFLQSDLLMAINAFLKFLSDHLHQEHIFIAQFAFIILIQIIILQYKNTQNLSPFKVHDFPHLFHKLTNVNLFCLPPFFKHIFHIFLTSSQIYQFLSFFTTWTMIKQFMYNKFNVSYIRQIWLMMNQINELYEQNVKNYTEYIKSTRYIKWKERLGLVGKREENQKSSRQELRKSIMGNKNQKEKEKLKKLHKIHKHIRINSQQLQLRNQKKHERQRSRDYLQKLWQFDEKSLKQALQKSSKERYNFSSKQFMKRQIQPNKQFFQRPVINQSESYTDSFFFNNSYLPNANSYQQQILNFCNRNNQLQCGYLQRNQFQNHYDSSSLKIIQSLQKQQIYWHKRLKQSQEILSDPEKYREKILQMIKKQTRQVQQIQFDLNQKYLMQNKNSFLSTRKSSKDPFVILKNHRNIEEKQMMSQSIVQQSEQKKQIYDGLKEKIKKEEQKNKEKEKEKFMDKIEMKTQKKQQKAENVVDTRRKSPRIRNKGLGLK